MLGIIFYFKLVGWFVNDFVIKNKTLECFEKKDDYVFSNFSEHRLLYGEVDMFPTVR